MRSRSVGVGFFTMAFRDLRKYNKICQLKEILGDFSPKSEKLSKDNVSPTSGVTTKTIPLLTSGTCVTPEEHLEGV